MSDNYNIPSRPKEAYTTSDTPNFRVPVPPLKDMQLIVNLKACYVVGYDEDGNTVKIGFGDFDE